MNKYEMLIYTRKPDSIYTQSLSGSIHFACRCGNEEFKPLNLNYGILFPEATISKQNTICEKNLKNPYIFYEKDGTFGIIAVRTAKDGIDDEESRGQILYWTSPDLISFNYHGLIRLHDTLFIKSAVCSFNAGHDRYEIIWKDNSDNIYISHAENLAGGEVSCPQKADNYPYTVPVVSLKDINPGNIIEVQPDIYQKSCDYWIPPRSNRINVHPLARGYADPVILLHNDKYYFISTNDNKNDIGLYVREADTIDGLFSEDFAETIILDADEEKGFVQAFWAPEFHYIGGELYIFFAVSGKAWGPQCHSMKLKKNGNITNPDDWETPVRVKKRDGTFLATDGITLDMTYFTAEGKSYVIWSYRHGIGTPSDTGSMLYIALIDDRDPSVLTGDPVLLSRPLLGWENIQGTINNEGPYPLLTDDAVYITYSGGAARGYTYSIGVLSIPRGSDYLNATGWKKSVTPVINYLTLDGLYGAGHNSFFRDRDGNIMIAYHAEEEIAGHGLACSAMHQIHFRQDGSPVFNYSVN